jgi:hypothetical protein
MAYRVVHCGTGYVGKNALKLMLQHPELELVGDYVSSPGKAGKDTGELIGIDPIGVVATNSWRELIDLKPDVLTYFADSVRREREALEDLIPFLEAGVNVVSLSTWELGHRRSMPPDLMARFDAACRKGNASAYFTSIDPGWATSELTISALAIANRVDCVRMIEFANFQRYTAEVSAREYFGFGQPPGYQPELVTHGIIEQMWAPTLHRIAEVLGVEIDEFRAAYATDVVDHDITCGFGVVKAGMAAVVQFELQGLKAGRPFVVLEHVDRLVEDPHRFSQWSTPKSPEASYRIEVIGDPSYSVELNGHHTIFCSTPIINCIPALVAAPPGVLSPLEMPRYWSQNVTARVGPWP